MVSPRGSPAPIAWEGTVSVQGDPDLEAEVLARFDHLSGVRPVGVTELLAARRSYYRLTAPPVPVPADRQARLDRGRAVHRSLGSRLASEGTLEARVRRGGLVGRIDILADVPVEVKTSTALAEPSALVLERPDHIEQLAMYCALLDRPVGRLLTVVGSDLEVPRVQAVDMAFGSPERIFREMGHRAERLRSALGEHSPDSLPRCPWFGRGCEYEGAGVCSCTGAEGPAAPLLAEMVRGPTPRRDVEERVLSALAERPPEEGLGVERFREVLYPRRAYFDRTRESPEAPPGSGPPSLEPDLYRRLSEALESGPAGEVARLPTRTTAPAEEVVGFRGRPMLLRTSRARNRLRPSELPTRFPQYALDLGLRCATTGTDSGVVVLGFERAATDRERVEVLEVRFASLTPFSRLYRERTQGLDRALEDHHPEALVACPEWMSADCPYRAECGCGPSGTRETR